jgi:hypothetical protein
LPAGVDSTSATCSAAADRTKISELVKLGGGALNEREGDKRNQTNNTKNISHPILLSREVFFKIQENVLT